MDLFLAKSPVSLNAGASKDEPHPSPDDLRRALVDGLGRSDRARFLIHFSLRCPRCLESLEELSREPPASVAGDPISLALGRWIEVLVGAPGLERRTARLRPAHSWWAHRFQRRPLGFARLVVEESRQKSLERPEWAQELSRTMDEALDDPRFDAVAASSASLRRPLNDLRGLAMAYHADCCRSAGETSLARHLFFNAELELDQGTHDDEIRATVYELQFLMARTGGEENRSRRCLDTAEAILVRSEVRMPGRLAETLILQGWRRMQADPAASIAIFRRALTELPAGASPALRYLAHHWLATAAHFAGKPRVARRHLREAEETELPYPMPVQRAQDRWLRGRLGLSAKRNWNQAEKTLRGALASFRELGLNLDAIKVLVDLVELGLRRGRFQDLEQLATEFRPLLSSPEALLLACYQLRDVIACAEALGISAPAIRDLYRELVFELTARNIS